MKNHFEIRGNVTAVFFNNKFGQIETLIDTKDLPRAQEFTGLWSPIWDKSTETFYVCGCHNEDGNWKTVRLHRWLLNASNGLHVDHINHQTLDNRQLNLRLCTISENNRNRDLKNNIGFSKYKGVGWHKHKKKYRARIKVNNKCIHLGYFNSEIKAALAYNSAANQYHGEFAKLNVVNEK